VIAPDPELRPRPPSLADVELDLVRAKLGREANELELAMFSVMWSERCSRKSSKSLLKTLPTAGPDVLAVPGEDAGVIALGDGLAVAFRIVALNDLGAAEPGRGASSGVGGVLHDIVAMGARPIAVLDALTFGDPEQPLTRQLVRDVVRMVVGTADRMGVATVGGELTFQASHGGSPLVNVMAVSLVEERILSRAAAPAPGNIVVLFGTSTGRRGTGGASVGDPFDPEPLIEASRELLEQGLVVALRGLDAAGITRGVSEIADRAGTGILIGLDAIPRHEARMAPSEVLTGEPGEGMLAIVQPAMLDRVVEVGGRGGLSAAVIGRVTDDGLVTVVAGAVDESGRPASGAQVLAAIPATALVSDAVVYERVSRPPTHRRLAPAPGAPQSASDRLPVRGMDPGAVLRGLLGSPNLGSREWVTAQYGTATGADTVNMDERAAGIVRIQGTRKGLACATDSAAPIEAFDPRLGAALAVAECARNVAVTGARPLGVTTCLNYGDPARPEAFWQLSEAVRGLGEACRALGLPVIGADVSLDGEEPSGPAMATAQIGVVGLLDDAGQRVAAPFRVAGDVVVLLGEPVPGLGGSAYAELAGAAVEERLPTLDLARERALQRLLLVAANEGILASAQDVSGGGLAVALAKCAIWGGIGASLTLEVGAEPVVELFGESPSRVVVTVHPPELRRLEALAAGLGVALARLGEVGGERLHVELVGGGAAGAAEERGASVADALDCTLVELRHAWEQALPRALGEAAFARPVVAAVGAVPATAPGPNPSCAEES
jgi:phosphoribosylformylglycinamidine synthase